MACLFGLQIVGKRWGESRLLAIAKALSEVTGEFRRPLGYYPLSASGRS
jgi:amidase